MPGTEGMEEAGREEGGRRHQSHQLPYKFEGSFNNDTVTVCYLNSAINFLLSSLLFNDIFFVIKSRRPLINQLHLIRGGSYPGQVDNST